MVKGFLCFFIILSVEVNISNCIVGTGTDSLIANKLLFTKLNNFVKVLDCILSKLSEMLDFGSSVKRVNFQRVNNIFSSVNILLILAPLFKVFNDLFSKCQIIKAVIIVRVQQIILFFLLLIICGIGVNLLLFNLRLFLSFAFFISILLFTWFISILCYFNFILIDNFFGFFI